MSSSERNKTPTASYDANVVHELKSNDATRMKNAAPNVNLKYVSLITLTAQNAILGLSMRYSRTRPGERQVLCKSNQLLFNVYVFR